MKKLILTLALMCFSCSLMASETYFVVYKKKDINQFISEMDQFVSDLNEKQKVEMGFRILDIKLDDCPDGWATLKYEYYRK